MGFGNSPFSFACARINRLGAFGTVKSTLRKATPFVVSLTLHLAVLLAVTFQFRMPESLDDAMDQLEQQLENLTAEKGKAPDNPEVIEKLEVELVESTPDMTKETGDLPIEPPPPEKPKLTECQDDRWYGGIGIQQDWRTNLVNEVYKGYPADKAGLRPGDIIEKQSEREIRGEPGTIIKILVYRQSTGERFVLEITRDKICIGARNEQSP